MAVRVIRVFGMFMCGLSWPQFMDFGGIFGFLLSTTAPSFVKKTGGVMEPDLVGVILLGDLTGELNPEEGPDLLK